jgi:hypothetical protein
MVVVNSLPLAEWKPRMWKGVDVVEPMVRLGKQLDVSPRVPCGEPVAATGEA